MQSGDISRNGLTRALGITMRVQGFPPISSASANRLILGSMPGKVSLAAREYYAHPRNCFWQLVGGFLGVPSGAPYQARCDALVERRLALWDVLRTCTRASSLDSDIDDSSIVPNDFAAFLSAHPDIGTIFFNGAKAEQMYRRHVLPGLPADLARIRRIRLPSTSPANASIPRELKLRRWEEIKVDA